MSDSPFPPDKRGKNPRSLANLKKSKPGDPPLNPKGNNGRTRSEYVAAWLEKTDETDLVRKMIKKLGLPESTPRIDALLQRDLVAALGGSDQARKLLIEQFAGKAAVKVDMTSSDGSITSYRENPVASMLEAMIARATANVEKAKKTREGSPEAEKPASG